MEYKNLSDEQLVSLAQNNDLKATDVLVERYKSTVASITRSYFLIGGDKEDLLQEGMIAMYSAMNSYNGQVTFKSYVYTCVKNRIVSLIKSSNNQKNKPLNNYVSLSGSVDGDADKTEIIIDSGFGPEEIFINRETVIELNQKIKKVLSEYEYTILSQYLTGLSYAQIAEKIGEKVKSIDNALQRIRQKLSVLIK
ncbi:MAG: sigma-70 family RNA polymerase sigma factor [Clostridiales bacterium]|nr:sigma-70 family RNA polymerase sigma factor [Clostridiales bacterium]